MFKRLGKDGYVVNVARGSVVDEDALVKCLKVGGGGGKGEGGLWGKLCFEFVYSYFLS